MPAAPIANKSTSTFSGLPWKQKTPPKRGFYQGFAVGCHRTHCVTSTRKVYAIEDERAIPARILTFLSMDRLPNFVHKILFIHTVFIYTEGVRSERGGRSLPAQRSPGWNGWCRQCLNPWSEHTVLRQSRCWPQAAERYASIVLLLTKRRRVWASWIWSYLSSNSLLLYCNCLMLSWNTFGDSGSSRTWEGRATAPL